MGKQFYDPRQGPRLTLPANRILAKANGRSQVDVQDIAECADMFLDARRSASLLNSEAGKGYLS